MNGWFSRCAAELTFTLTQHFPRCERTQQENRIHTLGSLLPFAAVENATCCRTSAFSYGEPILRNCGEGLLSAIGVE
jgi:hypothetical protein